MSLMIFQGEKAESEVALPFLVRADRNLSRPARKEAGILGREQPNPVSSHADAG